MSHTAIFWVWQKLGLSCKKKSSVAAYPGQKEYKNLENNRKELVKKIYSENLVFIDETEFSNYTWNRCNARTNKNLYTFILKG